VIDMLGVAGRLLLHGLVVGAPLATWQWVVLSCRHGRGTFGVLDPTLIAGAMVGFAALAVVIPQGALGFDAVVAAGGVWDLSAGGFLHRAGTMAARGLPALAELLRTDDADRDLRVWLSLAGVLWLLHVAAGLLRAGPSRAGLFLATELATLVASVYGTLYAGLLLVWLFNQLNVWALLLLILLIEDVRHNDPPWLAKFIAATGAFALRPGRAPNGPPPEEPPERTVLHP
jgi:hypothetical protein